MVTVILIACVLLLYTFQSVFCKLFTDHYKGDPAAASQVFTVLFSLTVGLISWGFQGFVFRPSPVTWLFGGVNALGILLYNVSLAKGSQKGSYSFLAVCMLSGGVILPLLASLLFLHTSLSVFAYIGIGLMLVVFLLMNSDGMSFKKVQPSYYLCCGGLFIGNGLHCSMVSLHPNMVDPAEYGSMLIIGYFGSMLIALVWLLFTRRGKAVGDFAAIGKKSWLFGVGAWLFAAVAVNLVGKVVQLINPAIYMTIDNGGVLVLSVLASMVLFKEKLTRWQVVGVLTAVASLVLLTF
ncbi:MAG: hypothetical protein IJ518_03440 [Clostridia bacterium]|nr:hypothetical protein [Clostridia bacterium]